MKLTQELLIGLIREEMENATAKPIAQTTSDILTALDSLYDSIVEDLDAIEDELLEADGTPSSIVQWMWWSPKARKSQAKVNKVKMNIVALEFARDNAASDAKKKLGDKVKSAKEQKKTLQSMVDDKFSSKGEITRKALSSEKIKGQLAAIKATTGMSNDPNRNKELKNKMKELNDKYRKEEAALAEIEPTSAEKKAEAKRVNDEEKEKIEQDKLALDAENNPNKEKIEKEEGLNTEFGNTLEGATTAHTAHKDTEKPTDEAALVTWNKKEETLRKAKMNANIAKLTSDLKIATLKEDAEKAGEIKNKIQTETAELGKKENFPASTVSAVETDVKKDKTPEQIEAEKKKEEDRRAALSQEDRDKEDDTSMEDDAIKRAEDDDKAQSDLGAEQAKVVKLKAAKAALTKAEEGGDAEAIEKAKKAITDIEAKENWQLDGTTLGGMLDARISKINSDAILTESKYQSQSIAERLRRLL